VPHLGPEVCEFLTHLASPRYPRLVCGVHARSGGFGSFWNLFPKMFCVGIREQILFYDLFYVLEVSPHPVLEVLLCVTDVDLACYFTLDLVDYTRNSADISILASS
jgi:hypothetical protein